MADVKSFVVMGDDTTENQVREISESPAYEDEKIRIMPDAHAGKGSCIGFTSTYSDKIVPNTVGVDIACRVSLYKLPVSLDDIDDEWFARLDSVINRHVPAGFNVRGRPDRRSEVFPYDEMDAWEDIDNKWHIICSMGTLGGGNHYIELDGDDDGGIWLAVHTGSRNLGLQVCNLYQKTAKENHPELKDLAYIEGGDVERYLNDMSHCNEWSRLNHMAIFDTILVGMRVHFDEDGVITCIHNYVDTDNGFIRKGAISAQRGQVGIVPLNMRDGTLVVKGRGDDDWNYSLPHGAGRVLSRRQAKRDLSLDEYRRQMDGIYTTSISQDTLDEAPDAYKPAQLIVDALQENAEILHRLTPIYNFKAK